MIQAFRRADSFYESARFRLRGVDADARYRITDLDSGNARELSGRELLENGLSVATTEAPAAIVIRYAKSDLRSW